MVMPWFCPMFVFSFCCAWVRGNKHKRCRAYTRAALRRQVFCWLKKRKRGLENSGSCHLGLEFATEASPKAWRSRREEGGFRNEQAAKWKCKQGMSWGVRRGLNVNRGMRVLKGVCYSLMERPALTCIQYWTPTTFQERQGQSLESLEKTNRNCQEHKKRCPRAEGRKSSLVNR